MKVFLVAIKQKRKGGKDRELFLKEEYDSGDGSLEFTEEREDAHQYCSVSGAEKSITQMRGCFELMQTLAIAECANQWDIIKSTLVIRRV